MTARPRVTLFSYHYVGSDRKAGFHWIADACWRLGWDVVFVTAPISGLSRLRGDFRFAHPVRSEANTLVPLKDCFASYVLYTRSHPVTLPLEWMNAAMAPFFARYGNTRLGALESVVRDSEVVIIESTPAVLLAPRLRALIPGGRLVYRASDDLTFPNLKTPPVVLRGEQASAPLFDLISAASHITVERLAQHNAVYHPHGVAKDLFDAANDSPFDGGINVVWVGTKWLDDGFLDIASGMFPDWIFHVIGGVRQNVLRHNIRYHGELHFESTVPFIRHADIGLSTFPPLDATNRTQETMAIQSLKTTQYTYCGLPIVAPSDLVIGRENVFPYDLSDPSTVKRALEDAAAAGRRPEMGRTVQSWEDLARTLLGVSTVTEGRYDNPEKG